MASSMLTAEVSASASTEADVDKALKAALHSCLNDPNFAIICDFLQKFSKDLGLDLPSFKLLLQWITKTDEVSPQLRDMQIKLLRKTRKTVHEKSWESALSKFCFTYSAQDGWEIERFGYKNCSVKVKLRILRELLEYQFEQNTKFRTKILTLSADSLRSKPIGRDRQGHSYWMTLDNECNIRIYQEHLDEEIWQVVATNREEFVNLLKRLRGSEVVLPCRGAGEEDDDTTSSSSQIESDSPQKALPTEEICDSQENEQKVPKLSIKFVQGKKAKEITNANDLGKGEEELADEEDAKLLKKSTNCSQILESDEEEFEEMEEELGNEICSDVESEDEINNESKTPNKYKTDQNLTRNLKLKSESKKVKPLLISQNKVINNQNCSTSSNSGKKRTLDQERFEIPTENENEVITTRKKNRRSLLDSKPTRSTNKYEQSKGCEESVNEDVEVEEEIDEEDIDSAAAEEDENEEKIIEDYDDENEEEETVGEEICEPILHVTGKGSGNECDAENYFNFIDYDLEDEKVLTLSETIVEDLTFFYGDGNGNDCLVGNDKNDDTTNLDKKSSVDNFETKIEPQNETQSEKSMIEKCGKATLFLEDGENSELNNTSKKSTLNDDELNDTVIPKHEMYAKNSEQTNKQINEKEEVSQINGEKKSDISSKNEMLEKNETHENQLDQTISETASKEDCKMVNNNLTPNTAFRAHDLSIQQVNASKMIALESLKKELRESKKNLLEKKLPSISEGCHIKLSNPPIYNRKRRLTDQLQPSTRPSNSDSEVELISENNEDCQSDKELEIDGRDQDIGCKRLKMRPRQAHTELRKKIEAQKSEANEETTSSSSGEEELRKRKKITSKQATLSEILKSEDKLKKLESGNDLSKPTEILDDIDSKSRSGGFTQQLPTLKQSVHIKNTKIKPTLAEIIEKKLKKTPEQIQTNTTPSDIDSNMQEATTAKELFPFPAKTRITKPLKKNLLIQIRQEESEDPVRRKRANSQELNTSDSIDIKSSVFTTKSCLNTSNIHTEKHKTTSERQRKRRSSEGTIGSKELELKKEVTTVKETVILKTDKSHDSIKQQIIEGIETNRESSLKVSSRRSGRRGGVAPIYVHSLQSKKNHDSTKNVTKSIFTDLPKIEPINAQSKKADVANTSNGDKRPLDAIDIKEADIKKNINLLEIIKIDVSKPKSSTTSKTTAKGTRKQREVDTTNIIDIDSETPVRQSRRIAQQKIREEAERRKLEEIALRSMKQELKKKKKAEKQADPTVLPPTEPSSESEESNVEIKRKIQKKKCPGKNGNWSSGSEEQEEPEEEDEDHHHYETDPGSPLFKSDHEFSPESDIEDESQVVPTKRARTVRKEDAGGEDAATAEEESCQKCNKSDHPEWILLCDTCDKGYHCSCLSPVLFYIPEGDWYCPPCQQEQLIKALENQLKEFDDLVENKKKLEEHEKRMAEEEKARQEREEEANKHRTKKDKRIDAKRNIDTNADHSQEDDNEEEISNSDDSTDRDSQNPSRKNKKRNSSRIFKMSDKRNHRDRRTNASRVRRNRLQKLGSESDSDSQDTSKSNSMSKSSSSSSSTYSESDNEPIYKLRKRRQINVSYRLNEYDDLINSALKKEMDEVAGAGNLGRGKDISTIIEADKEEKARQKQIDGGDEITNRNEEKNDKQTKQDSLNVGINERNKNDGNNEPIKNEEIDSDAEPIMRKLNIKPSQKKKSRKLTTLDISSEDDDGSDEDFKGSSIDDEEEEEDTSISASNSDSSLEIYKRHGKFKKKRRKAARRAYRERRRVRRFLVEESDDEDAQRPKSKKKRKDDSDYTESDADDDDISELSENIDSADLCDDTSTDESDGAWNPNKRKKAKKSTTALAHKSPKSKGSLSKKPKKVEYSDDDVSDSEDDDDNDEVGSGKGMGKQPRSQPLKTSSTFSKAKGKGKEKPGGKPKNKSSADESSKSDSEDSTRRTRGRRYAYIEDFDDDSSDGGIKPGVQRPDTPPEEREKFIKRQEEIKRMLAEKNAEGAKLVATPRLTPIKTDTEKDKRSPAKTGVDSLSTVPLSVIRQAKVLDIDYLQRRGENLDDLSTEVGEVDDDFDDADLPDDLPEDMDEDTIARMVDEEEEFGVGAVRELPAPDEVLRSNAAVKPVKAKEAEKSIIQGNTSSQLAQNSQVTAVTLPSPTSLLQEPVRKRLPMPTMHPPLLRHQFLMHDSMHNTHQMQRHGGALTSHLLQNALSAPLSQPLDRNYPSVTSSSPHHSIITRVTHATPLQPTVSHSLSTARPSHPPNPSVHTKSSPYPDQPAQEKSTHPQNITENKPRGRRKKITPLRDTLQKQQTAAAVTAANASSSALASSLVKSNDPASTSLLSNVIKSGLSQKLIMHASGVTNVPPTSHSANIRPGIPMPPIRSPYIRTDGPRFFEALGNRISHTGGHRHRGPPQMPPSLLPPNPANRSSYGPPPPLKGSNSGAPLSSSTSVSGSIRNPTHHVPPPYMGMPSNARHSSHLNMYRPPIYGNPNFGPRVNLRPPNAHPPDFPSSSRAYPPYGFYPPPPPLTTPVQRPGLAPLPRSSTQMPPIQSTHPSASVIVSATSSKSSNSKSATPQLTPSPTLEITDPNSISKSVAVTQELQMKIIPPKPSTEALVIENEEASKVPLSVSEPRKKLTTLQAYSGSTDKKSPMLLASDSSGSQSPHNTPTGVSDESSPPEHLESTSIAEQPSREEGQASEFSGLVSYFSSQHDDYNT